MKNSRLIQLLECLNRGELQELKEFIQCKIFHSNKKKYSKVVEIFQKLISSKFKILTPEKKLLCSKLFDSKTTSMGKLNHHISQATDLVQKFLIYKYHTNDSIRYKKALLKALKDKREWKLFGQLKPKIQSDLSQKTKKTIADYYNYYELADMSLRLKNVRDKGLIHNNVDLEIATSNLDIFFILNQLNYACHTMNNRQIIQTPQYKFPLLNNLLEKLPETPYFELPLVRMYWNTYQMLTLGKQNYYYTLKILLFKYYDVLLTYHSTNLFRYLQNYCAQKISNGAYEYYSDFWEISLFRLEKGIIKKMDLVIYKNLITTGVMLALQKESPDFSEVLNFMQNHTDKLLPGLQEEAQNYAEAYLAFYQNNFQIVPQKLIIHQNPLTIYKFQDIYYQIDARRLVVMAYFCLDEDDNFDKMCSNLSVFLSERKEVIPGLELEKNRQFLIIVKKLFWTNGSRTEKRERLERLKKDMEAAKYISDRNWLLKQIELKSN